MRVRLAEGVYVDFYNLHTNAGTTDARPGRPRGQPQRSCPRSSPTHSAGNAVIVMGDTNTRYTRAGDNIARLRRRQRPHRRLGPA